MTIRRAIAEIIAKGRGGDRWSPTIDDDESSVLILEHIKKSVPDLKWAPARQSDWVCDPYRLCFRMDGTYGVFYHMSFIGAGQKLEDAKAIAQQWDTHLKTGWLL